MNMTTSIDSIPMKTNNSETTSDDSDDPIVKDILNEFQHELENQFKEPKEPKYIINNQPPQPIIQPPKKPIKPSYYNEEFIRKTAIIIIIIALVFSPIMFSSIIEKLPPNISIFLDNYNFYIKLILSFIIIYGFYYYNLL
jgi:hypothetical protein